MVKDVFICFHSSFFWGMGYSSDWQARKIYGKTFWNCAEHVLGWWMLSCLRHAADTPPLEGLLILRCAIYYPLERLHIFKNQGLRNGGTGCDFRSC